MAETEDRILDQVADETGEPSLASAQVIEDRQPVYKMRGESKRPVSKHAGALWRSRKEAGIKKLETTGKLSNWDEAIRYYKNDQRKNGKGGAVRTRAERNKSDTSDAENLVFANTSALVPSLYAKNPVCEITPNIRDDSNEETEDDAAIAEQSATCERLVNALIGKKAAPGINLKPKARKCVLMTTLTNLSYIEIGWTFKDDSSEEALQDLQRIGQEMAQAKDQSRIKELEGQLEALENKIDFLRPSGPWAKFRHPRDVIRDPDAQDSDFSDAQWMMIRDYVSTSFINAVYREKNGDDEYRSIYKPTHVIGVSSGKEIEDQINSFSLVNKNDDYSSFGYKDKATYDKACRTAVWYVWDKVTRRVYMFNEDDWSWPIWVWDDPYNLDTFFPLYPLEFYTDPEDDIGTSEVVYYLDQQDSINDINAEMRTIRQSAMTGLFYNNNVIKDAGFVDRIAEARTRRDKAIGVNVPPDTGMSKMFFTFVPPSVNYIQLFDKQPLYQAVDRMSSVPAIMRGEQFKTNTTNDAVSTYNSQQQTRLDEKIDAVEDWLGNIAWGTLQLCLQFMSSEQVGAIIGQKAAENWQQLSPDQIATMYSIRIVGGSTQKPTSQAKKQEALQVGQILGQFGGAGGGATILMVLKVMERAFDEIVMTKDDWTFLQTAIMQSIQNSNPTGNPQQGGAPAQGGDEQGGGIPPEAVGQIAAQIDSLPPQLKQQLGAALGAAMAKGVPLIQAIPALAQELMAAQQQQQGA